MKTTIKQNCIRCVAVGCYQWAAWYGTRREVFKYV